MPIGSLVGPAMGALVGPAVGAAYSAGKYIVGRAAQGAAQDLVGRAAQVGGSNIAPIPVGRDVEIYGRDEVQFDPGSNTYAVVRPQRRRRRKRLLTCSDKSDIAFLRGQLGGGELGRAAITALLSRRCS